MDCVFCQIAEGDILADLLFQNEEVVAFRDTNPVAPTHLLIIPRRHIASLADITDADSALMGEMIRVANIMADNEGIRKSGYRLVINCGEQGGQVMPHLHMHLIGGRRLGNSLS